MTSLEHLLPAPDQSVRCSDHSRSLMADPGGTAIRADRVILIETPRPWPKPVFEHPLLAGIDPILKASKRPTRTLAHVPPSDAERSDVGPSNEGHGSAPVDHALAVITFDRPPHPGRSDDPLDGVVERRFRPGSAEEVLRLATALAGDDMATIDAMAHHRAVLIGPVLLVCTQGSHDVCCGSDGQRFAVEAESIDDLTVYRVSHTGGHRFAPTAMTLPDGRMWADLDLDLLRRVLFRTGDAADVVDRCRGWWGADTGPAQVAERAVLGAVGWSFEHRPRSVEVVDVVETDGGARSFVCVVATADRSWEVSLSEGRTVPTIACRLPGGLPAKSSVEYRIDRITPQREGSST